MRVSEWTDREKTLWEEFRQRDLVEIVYYVMDDKYNHAVSVHDTYEEALKARMYRADYIAAGLNSPLEVRINE